MFTPLSILYLVEILLYSSRISSVPGFSTSVSSVSVQPNLSEKLVQDFFSSYGLSIFSSFNSSNSLRIRVRVFLSFMRQFRCRKRESVVLLFWFVRYEEFVQVRSQIGITFRNQTEDCQVHWFDKFGFHQSEHGKVGILCNFLDSYGDYNVLATMTAKFCQLLLTFSGTSVPLLVLSNVVTIPLILLSGG